MTHLIADDAMLAILSQAKELAEIRDPSGKVVGFFAPVSAEKAALYARAAAHIDPAEIAKRKSEVGQGRTTREIFEHLQSLTKDAQERADLQAKIDRLKERDGCAIP